MLLLCEITDASAFVLNENVDALCYQRVPEHWTVCGHLPRVQRTSTQSSQGTHFPLFEKSFVFQFLKRLMLLKTKPKRL